MKYILIITFLFISNLIWGQNAIKLEKQKTNFFYTQLNLHYGYVSDVNGERFDFANRSPNNQLVFQYLGKSQRNLQRGYTKLISLSSYKARLGVIFDKYINTYGVNNAKLDFKLFDTWLKFNTKWDRTNIWIGNKSIPYGHNPKIDPASSFMTNLIKMDLGFAQDLGVFIKTPISKKLDAEMSITTGGLLNRAFLVCDNLIDQNKAQFGDAILSFDGYDYNNTWLTTARVGNQTFKVNEFGIIALLGNINGTFLPEDRQFLTRIGGDWVYKHHETVKFTNQIMIGRTISNKEGKFLSLNAQSSLDIFLKGRFILSNSFAFNYAKGIASKETINGVFIQQKNNIFHLNSTLASSFTFAATPHTRLRLNYYNTLIKEVDEKQWGILFQVLTGFGKRN